MIIITKSFSPNDLSYCSDLLDVSLLNSMVACVILHGEMMQRKLKLRGGEGVNYIQGSLIEVDIYLIRLLLGLLGNRSTRGIH